MKTSVRAHLLVIAAAALFSTGGAAIKTSAFTAMQVSAARSGFATLALVLWLRGRVPWDRRVISASLVYAATVTLFVAATKLTTAANAIFMQSTAPAYLLVFGPWLLHERPHRTDLFYLAAVGVGVIACAFGLPEASVTAPDPATGNLLGIICSVTWAFTLIALRSVARGGSVERTLACVVFGNAIACVGGLAFAWPFPSASFVDWSTLLFLGVFQIAFAYVCLTLAMRELRALDVSLLLLLEPVMNPVWTWLIRGEAPGTWVMVGGALILAATAIRTWADTARVP